MTTLNLAANTIDIRDIIARVEELEQAGANVMADEMTDEDAELSDLLHILDDLAGAGGDEQWRGDWYPLTLIHEDHFEDHARELAEDIGAVNKGATWPNNCIDWSAAADQLRYDYSEIDVEGTTYYYR